MSDINILVVEDDSEINHLVSRTLLNEGYTIDSVFNGLEALQYFKSKHYHMIILDLMIPKTDGYEVLRRVREKSNIPILILSAKSEDTDKIIGLGLGADDYMIKPFNISELVARVKAQLRRYLYFNSVSVEEVCLLKHLEMELDLNTFVLKVKDKQIVLSSKEFEILKLLMSNPKRVFTKDVIYQSVWGEDFIADENTIMIHIHRLREKIEDDASKPRYIKTIWGIGYKLAEV